MKKWAMGCAAVAMAAAMTGCNQAPADTHDADVAALKSLETQWSADWGTRNADKIMSYYASDATLMASGGPAATGTDAVKKMVQEILSDPAAGLQFTTTKADVSGGLGYTQGTYTMTMTNPATKQPMTDHGSYVTVYKKQADGSWKAEEDVAVSDAAPAAPAPAAASMPGMKM